MQLLSNHKHCIKKCIHLSLLRACLSAIRYLLNLLIATAEAVRVLWSKALLDPPQLRTTRPLATADAAVAAQSLLLLSKTHAKGRKERVSERPERCSGKEACKSPVTKQI